MKLLGKGLLILLAVGILDIIVLVGTWFKRTNIVNDLDAHRDSLGPLLQGWLQVKHLEHLMYVEGGILVLIALLAFILWRRRVRLTS